MSPAECTRHLEDHTAILADHEARLKNIEHRTDAISQKLDRIYWLILAIILEVPITVIL